jgi:hypothetical protein
VPAIGQKDLLITVDDLTIGVIAVLLFIRYLAGWIAIKGRGQAGLLGEFEQARQKPGITLVVC